MDHTAKEVANLYQTALGINQDAAARLNFDRDTIQTLALAEELNRPIGDGDQAVINQAWEVVNTFVVQRR